LSSHRSAPSDGVSPYDAAVAATPDGNVSSGAGIMTGMSNRSTDRREAAVRHVNLDDQDEAVKHFVMELVCDEAGSIIELAGRAIAQVLPPAAGRNGEPPAVDDWTDAKNVRRCELIDKEVDGTMTPAEQTELEDLQEQMLRHRHRVAPLPLAYTRRLLEELERKASGAAP